ncbi:MAG: NTE family protein rssA, partial [Alphaproteobacteria bacterium]|nr:NTE family protein rssA [Alphaproteobacteria bacterium]
MFFMPDRMSDRRNAPQPRAPRIGIAIGAGSARGWTHIGMLRELHEAGIRPAIVAGASIGAVVGGCYCSGKLDELEDFARSLNRRRLFGLLDVSFSGAGLITGGRLKARLDAALGNTLIEELATPFTAVATEMGSGHEIWLNRGPLADSLRASYALPGLFEHVKLNGRWLFDGALVNPVPTSVCHARGADFVIALNLNTEPRRTPVEDDIQAEEALGEIAEGSTGGALRAGRAIVSPLRKQFASSSNGAPGLATAMIDAFNISQDRITRSRLAGDLPD